MTGLWAKVDRVTGQRHPLAHHAADVAAVFECLLASDVVRSRLERIAGCPSLTDIPIARLYVFAALHDLGKCNHAFQERINGGRGGGHVSSAIGLMTENSLRGAFFKAVRMDLLAAWCGNEMQACEWLWSAISHHGRPADKPHNLDRRIWQTRDGVDPMDGIRDLMNHCEQWFPEAFSMSANLEPLPAFAPLHHAFAGLLMIADWIGSDIRFFPFSSASDDERMPFARKEARRALETIGVMPDRARSAVIERKPGFDSLFGHATPRPLQESITEIPASQDNSIVVLEAETGSGKTEAAFLHFKKLFAAGLVDGMYFALPTRSAATQIHGRIARWARNAFCESAPPVVLGVPGYMRVDIDDGIPLPGFEVLWPDEMGGRGWAAEHAKRYMAGAIVVGTIDQALFSVLQVNHALMRSSALLRLLLVVDEVHASDTYMNVLLREVLRVHVGAGGHALLMSATLGAETRVQLMAPESPRVAVPDLATAEATSYPVLMRRTGAPGMGTDTAEMTPIDDDARAKTVMIEIRPLAEDHVVVAAVACAAAKNGGRVLVLRNRVKDAVKTQIEAEGACVDPELLFRCKGVAATHHGRFAPEDRRRLDDALEEQFGRSSPEGRGGLVVATQTVEQSLDIDFDLILTDLAPMDVLLQRIGRLHRHARPRPAGFDAPRIIIMTPENRDLGGYIIAAGELRGAARGPSGIGTVYEDLRVLEATWSLLETHPVLRIPTMNRMLVERATHPDSLARIVKDQGGPWPGHEAKMLGQGFARRGAARLALVDREAHYGERDSLYATGLEERIQTRLGADDRLVLLHEPVVGPFGAAIRSLRLPGWLVKSVPGDADPHDLAISTDAAGAPLLTFSYGTVRFEYGRLGLRRADG